MLELLIVLLILSASLAVVAQPIFQRTPRLHLRSSAASVAAVLREARSLAIRDNQEMRVMVDVEARSLRIGADERDMRIDGDVGISLYTATTELQGRDRGAIAFFPDGTSTGGRIRLFSGEITNDVVVNWLTGHVDIHENAR